MSEDEAYVCEKCGKRVPRFQLISETDPDLWHNKALRRVCIELREKQGEPTPPSQLYHQRHAYSHRGGTSHMYLCGPMHLETEQEYFVNSFGRSKPSDD